MRKHIEVKNAVLKESTTDIKLKDYFRKMIDFTGEDYALLSLSNDEGLKDSIDRFSSSFQEETDDDLAFSLLRNAILSSNQENNSLSLIHTLIENNSFDDLLFIIKSNLGFRRDLTRAFMNHCNESFAETYLKRKSDNNEISQLLALQEYENSLKSKVIKKELILKGSK